MRFAGGRRFENVDSGTAFVFMEARLDRANVNESRQTLMGFSERAERINRAKADCPSELEPLLRTLDEVYEKLKATEDWVT